jgi:hypothetical protein
MMELTATQLALVEAEGSLFALGPAGVGKSTALQQRLLRLLDSGESAYNILLLVAEPEQRPPFLAALHQSRPVPYAELSVVYYYELAREMTTLFWPLVARPAGFARPFQPPTFLSYDLAQLLMWQTITPMLNEGAFGDVRLRPQQIISQLLDTLNRAALNGLTLAEAVRRQVTTWAGESDFLRHLEEAAEAARRFRQRCLERSLLDLSLIVETFDRQIVHHPEFHRYFKERYRHLLVDNVEEQTPAGQNFITNLMPHMVSATIVYDAGGGYKRFMAADPAGANQFRKLCAQTVEFGPAPSFTSSPALDHLANLVENYLLNSKKPTAEAAQAVAAPVLGRYRREIVAGLAPVLHRLRQEGVAPQEMAIITPYLDGALRYSLTQMLQEAGLPYYLLRRRSSPREEPRIRAWLTWLALAHPTWDVRPAAYDVAEALSLTLAGMDAARAALTTQLLYDAVVPALRPSTNLAEAQVERIGAELVDQVELLRQWLLAEGGRHPVDLFLHRLFNDLLARPPFRQEPDLAGAAVCDWLVRTAARLQEAAPAMGSEPVGPTFIAGIQQGLVTADPPDLGDPPDPNGIMIATIYAYLLAGKPVRVQVWLEAAATGWWEIPRQPLSNAFVLAQSWRDDRPWTMEEDFAIRNQLLSRIARGLAARCREQVILAHSELDRRGQRQEGPLWRAIQPMLRAVS